MQNHGASCVPVTLWFASLSCSVLETYYAGLEYKGQSFEFVLIAMKAVTGLYIVITIYTTTAIIYRVLSRGSIHLYDYVQPDWINILCS
ncbi:hypothetical protein M378DRAFT_634549 [Amanita muscaria Koide BX008]|uniref:Uncharacterized protein n=1 Tax=Amanita muscaria (strain Koide BX008) TaxID=946122 RepID=A0A0C2WGZ3_AMAMK|nr:hypothetical protein M378DRAFT_634549 [Amanita muscaria Koide BX008]